ncbi:trace amine-associated receptor 1-like [Sphaeramia orbicularis]|uniref:trace amine-associated receptor 1-like n=1 Tax=Sphaeramia orbicularis TaxID=375764 RepID=UPI00117F58A0|nr:trace amine-associated receptor 1-like [Sphaeramia orbicularis]
MDHAVSVNRTDVTDMHPCYEMDHFNYKWASSPSITCVMLNVFLAILAIVTVCGNLLVIISVIYFKQLHTPPNYLILSLAVADLLVGVTVFPLSMAFSVSSCLHHGHLFCKVRGSFDISLSTCSILNLCCISIDRYYAVCQPLIYRTKINDHVVTILILVSWALSVLIGIGLIIARLNNGKCEKRCLVDDIMANTVGPVLSFYLPVIIMLCIYFKIFVVALKQVRSIQNTKSGGTSSKMERKATKTLAVVLGVFLVCWTPFFLTKNTTPVPVIEALNWLTLSNSMLNPFIYAFFYSWFRSAFRMLISGKIFQGNFANSKLL